MSDPAQKRLAWKRQHTDPQGYIAYPEGEETAPMARIEFSVSRPRATAWSWWVAWPGRFNDYGAADTKQAAAHRATEAYWRQIEATLQWTLPAEPLVPPVVASLSRLTDGELEILLARYHHAVAQGNAGIESDKARDLLVHRAIFEERHRRGGKPKRQQWGEP